MNGPIETKNEPRSSKLINNTNTTFLKIIKILTYFLQPHGSSERLQHHTNTLQPIEIG